MSTETRIGIVAGLLIVVVASVYFFYGRGAGEPEFLVSTGSDVFTAPPAVPTEDPKADSGQSRDAGKRNPAPKASRKKSLSPGGRRGTPDVPHRVVKVPPRTPPAGSAVRRPEARRRPRVHTPAPRRGRTAARTPSTTLRTGPARQLVEATRENLDQNSGSTAKGSKTKRATPIRNRERRNAKPTDGGRTHPAGTSSAENATGRRSGTVPSGNRMPASPVVWPKRHTIVAGDTLSEIALRYYDDSEAVRLIVEANPQVRDPHALRIGDVLAIPRPSRHATTPPAESKTGRRVDAPSKARASPPKTYRVRAGDTFYSIAKATLGSGERWREIYKLNKDLVKGDDKGLRPGMVVKLP